MTGRRLGQHFLNAQWVARDLIEAVAPREGEVIMEIGPGRGALTERLLETGNTVVAIEKDEALTELLLQKFASEIAAGKLHLMQGDIRDGDGYDVLEERPYVIAANIPYYITGEIIRDFLTAQHQPRAAALLIQKEVAERICAKDGKESILSLSVKAYGTPRLAAKVPASAFNPPPAVDSAILLIDDISHRFFEGISEERYFEIVKTGFSSKRKMLARNLAPLFPDPRAALESAGIPTTARAEDVPLAAWKRLASA